MLNFRNMALATVAAVASLTFVNSAQAATYDTTLIDPPGVYFGNGNVNAHFVTNVASNIELGLGTVERFVGPVIPDAGTSVYHVNTGTTSEPGKTGTDWGFVFSINTNANGAGSLTLADIVPSICIQDIGQGVTNCFNPFAIFDNAHAASSPTTTAQNSEALQFSTLATRFFLPNFDIDANDTYIFTLNASIGGNVVNSVQMTDIAGTGASNGVPEPLSLGLLGMGLFGLAAARRKRNQTA